MESDLVVYDVKPLRAVDVRAQVNLIQEVMKSVMQKDQHYGVIPGAGNKPTLFKAGAEKIMSTFRLAADPEVEDMSTELVMRYRVKCKLISAAGTFVGAGLGECSSAEEKYAWRGIVSEGEWNATDEADRRTKFKRDGQIKQVRTNPYDLSNTILKMAKKRALVDAVLTVTGASDIFTQDIEDMPAEVLNQKPPVAMPQERKAEGTGTAGDTVVTGIEQVTMKTGEKNGKPWTLYTIHAGEKYTTFDKKHAETAKAAAESGLIMALTFTQTEKGRNLTGITEHVDRQPGEEG